MDLLAGKRAPAEGGQICAEADVGIWLKGVTHEGILPKAGESDGIGGEIGTTEARDEQLVDGAPDAEGVNEGAV